MNTYIYKGYEISTNYNVRLSWYCKIRLVGYRSVGYDMAGFACEDYAKKGAEQLVDDFGDFWKSVSK